MQAIHASGKYTPFNISFESNPSCRLCFWATISLNSQPSGAKPLQLSIFAPLQYPAELFHAPRVIPRQPPCSSMTCKVSILPTNKNPPLSHLIRFQLCPSMVSDVFLEISDIEPRPTAKSDINYLTLESCCASIIGCLTIEQQQHPAFSG